MWPIDRDISGDVGSSFIGDSGTGFIGYPGNGLLEEKGI